MSCQLAVARTMLACNSDSGNASRSIRSFAALQAAVVQQRLQDCNLSRLSAGLKERLQNRICFAALRTVSH